MNLSELVDTYVDFKRALGAGFQTDERVLRAFSKALGDIDPAAVEPDHVSDFLKTNWHRKFAALTGFYRFAIARDYVSHSPLPTVARKCSPSFTPYIYTPGEVKALLASARKVCVHARCPIDSECLRSLVALLWGAGLRLSEGLNLTVSDVDLASGLLTINDTKFYKSRLVPMDPRLSTLLSQYSEKRRLGRELESGNSFFFKTKRGTRLSRNSVQKYFRKLCTSAGVERHDGARYHPRLHDLRHTFAVSRVLHWYRQGGDVQHLLPHLSTYLGHGSLAATQRYLTTTPEVLREACRLFENYALEVDHGKH